MNNVLAIFFHTMECDMINNNQPCFNHVSEQLFFFLHITNVNSINN